MEGSRDHREGHVGLEQARNRQSLTESIMRRRQSKDDPNQAKGKGIEQ
jgi:hypothetical protein